MYDSIQDLPFVCRLNLPEAAQRIYRDAFNRAWRQTEDAKTRYRFAQQQAWIEVRKRFEREKETGRWIARSISRARTSDMSSRA
jgi:cation transport regulator ChaB